MPKEYGDYHLTLRPDGDWAGEGGERQGRVSQVPLSSRR